MKKILASAFLLTISQSIFAETVDNRPDTVIVTATRTAQTVDESLSSVTVITSEDIERQNATSLQEVLQSVAGVTMTSSGGQGTLSSMFLRGTESNHVVVLIDGIKHGSASTGKASLEFLPLEQIDRIEIVRGPRSSLYGSEAIGGVIQIFTRKGQGITRPTLSITAGSYNSLKAVAAVSGSEDKIDYYLSLSSYDTDGFNACNGQPMVGGCNVIEPDDDGFHYLASSASLGYKLTENTDLRANWLSSKGNVRYDGSYYNHSHSVNQTEGVKLSHQLSSIWLVEFQLGQSNDRRKEYFNNTFRDFNNTERNSSSLQNNFVLGSDSELVIGLDYLDDQLESNTPYNETSRFNKGFFAQFLQQLNNQNFQFSARYDENEQFGSHSTGSIAWGLDLNKKQRITASYSTAFAAPTFDDLYYPWGGNPDLKPEDSATVEIGFRNRISNGSIAVNVYQTEIDQLIVWNSTTFITENIDEVTIRGIEFVLGARLMGWDTQLDVSLLDPENKSGPYKNKVLIRRAKESARFVATRTHHKLSYGTTIIFNGKRYEDSANLIEMDSYYTIDLNGGYKINKDWLLRASIKNMFDEDYELVKLYNTPGRNYLLTVSYQPVK